MFLLPPQARERNYDSILGILTRRFRIMLRITVTCFALLSVLFLGKTLNYADQPQQKDSGTLSGTLQKMIVENGSVTMNVDLNGLNGSNDLTARPVALHFGAATNSFFP